MEEFVACISTILVIIISRESVTDAEAASFSPGTNNAWEYTCNITNCITGVSWSVLKPNNQLQVLSTCNISSQWCIHTDECSAVASISGLTSLLNISSSFLINTQVICTEVNDTRETQTHADIEGHPINWTCDRKTVSESTRGLSSTLQASSNLFTTTTISDTSATTSNEYPATSKASTTTSEAASTIWKTLTTSIETSTTVTETSTISDEVFVITSKKSRINDDFTTTTSEAPTTEGYTVSEASFQITSSQNPSKSVRISKITTNLPTRRIVSSSNELLTTSDQSTEPIYSRDSAGGAPAGAIAGSMVGIIALCVIFAVVFVIYKRKQKRNTCPPSDQNFPAETVVVDCVNPVYQTSEAISSPQAVQTPGTSSDISQPQETGTGVLDDVGQYAATSTTPSTATSNQQVRSKLVKPERKFLSKSAYMHVSTTPETGGDVYAVVDKPRKSHLITDKKRAAFHGESEYH